MLDDPPRHLPDLTAAPRHRWRQVARRCIALLGRFRVPRPRFTARTLRGAIGLLIMSVLVMSAGSLWLGIRQGSRSRTSADQDVQLDEPLLLQTSTPTLSPSPALASAPSPAPLPPAPLEAPPAAPAPQSTLVAAPTSGPALAAVGAPSADRTSTPTISGPAVTTIPTTPIPQTPTVQAVGARAICRGAWLEGTILED